MLIRVQRPGAAAVGSRQQWASIGRDILPDAVPVVILRPFGPVEFVYELADTAGAPIPGEERDPLRAVGKVPALSWDRTVRAAARCGIVVEAVTNYGQGRAGSAARMPAHAQSDANTETGNKSWRVKVNGKLDEATRFATLAHELAHVYCGHLGEDAHGLWPDRSRHLTEDQMEIEAEAAAWLVCKREGIETHSSDYIAQHTRGDALTGISTFAIMSAAHRIEARGLKEKTQMKRPRIATQMPLFG